MIAPVSREPTKTKTKHSMKFKPIIAIVLLSLLCLLLLPAPAPAEEPGTLNSQPSTLNSPRTDFYSGKEFQLDLAGQYGLERSAHELFESSLKGGDVAVSFGVGYYLTEHIGIGMDYSVLEPGAQEDASAGPGSKSLVKAANVNLLLRYPIWRFAPYALAGVGRDWHHGEYTCHAGAGIELRLSDGLGTFTEVRQTWTASEKDTMQFRAGLRVAKWK